MGKKVVLIIGVGSDIGRELARRYLKDGYKVVGTYRTSGSVEGCFKEEDDISLYSIELASQISIHQFENAFKKLDIVWDIYISAPATPLPMQNFFEADFHAWSDSVHINSIHQLKLLHTLHKYRNTAGITDVFFFGTAGINSEVVKFSAVASGKILLLKMCEYLDAENEDMKFMLIGPGWVKTKVHDLILENSDKGDEKYQKTKEFMQNNEGTSMQDIYECFVWLRSKEKALVSGRNFSVVHDPWRNEALLLDKLKSDGGLYKLKRHGNDWHK
ncbi:SDR family oxidoreductase [bacterium]|nr:SDR family oxidoreductase [bacterium]MBU1994482.1 SDR family oxidoreductase [bacterium]